MPRGASTLRETTRLVARIGEDGHGTGITEALARSDAGHQRVIILSDMQTSRWAQDTPYRLGMGAQHPGMVFGLVPGQCMQDAATSGGLQTRVAWVDGHGRLNLPTDVPVYGFNLAGYTPTILSSTLAHTEMGGLTDATFRMIPLIERGRDADWPF